MEFGVCELMLGIYSENHSSTFLHIMYIPGGSVAKLDDNEYKLVLSSKVRT